ncbi:MAG: hypothetical protein SWX82_12785 [Cyanobacteriota bacterium]|nr:hypothetical protein [Cyanobacteriota bacterium]
MEIYVQSRGYDQDKDYRWIKVIEDGRVKDEIPPLSKNAISLIESSSPSVVLERLPESCLLLLITGLEPEKRLDIIGRQIRIDLAFVDKDTDENELILRQLAVRALVDEKCKELTKDISLCVELLKNPDFLQVNPEDVEKVRVSLEKSNFQNRENLTAELNLSEKIVSDFFDGKAINALDFAKIYKTLELDSIKPKEIYLPPDVEYSPNEDNIYSSFVNYGFYVSFFQILEVISAEKIGETPASKAVDSIKKIGPNIPELRKQLAEEISHSKLPSEIAPLLVVTGFKKMETLREAQIWRGLSKLVDTEGWTEIPQAKSKVKLYLSIAIEVVLSPFKWLKSLVEPK